LDVDENGNQLVVSSGALRAKFRALDEEKSTPSHPIHPWAEPVPVEPGMVYEYNIHMMQTACVFQKGHKIELLIRNQDDLTSKLAMNGVYRMPFMQTVEHKIYFGQSHLLLTLIPTA
jgi:predicted acyl esterase